jgi:hypothetical protein
MRIASFIAIFALTPWYGYSATSLSGIWVLNVKKSDFGLSDPPERLIVRLQQADTSLAIWQLTSDSQGLHVTNQKYDLVRRSDPLTKIVRSANRAVVLRLTAPGIRITERWRVLRTGNLIITRVTSADSRKERQRLVLEPTKSVLE